MHSSSCYNRSIWTLTSHECNRTIMLSRIRLGIVELCRCKIYRPLTSCPVENLSSFQKDFFPGLGDYVQSIFVSYRSCHAPTCSDFSMSVIKWIVNPKWPLYIATVVWIMLSYRQDTGAAFFLSANKHSWAHSQHFSAKTLCGCGPNVSALAQRPLCPRPARNWQWYWIGSVPTIIYL